MVYVVVTVVALYRSKPAGIDAFCSWFVLQVESVEMLSSGFKDQIYDVYRYLPPELHVIAMISLLNLCKVGVT